MTLCVKSDKGFVEQNPAELLESELSGSVRNNFGFLLFSVRDFRVPAALRTSAQVFYSWVDLRVGI